MRAARRVRTRQHLCLTVLLAVMVLVLLGAASAQAFTEVTSPTTTVLPNIPKGTDVFCRDGGVSFLYAGRKVFTFGDTALTRANSVGSTWVTNTMYHTDDAEPDDGIGGGYNYKTAGQPPLQWVPLTPTEVEYDATHSPSGFVGLWPNAPFRDPDTGKQYFFFGKVIEHPGAWWDAIGTGITEVVTLTSPTLRIQHRAGESEDYILFGPDDGFYGDAAAVWDGHAYAYYAAQGWDFGKLFVARAPLADEAFKSRTTWRFWNGSSWVEPASAATRIIPSGVAPGSIEWNDYLGSWLYTYMECLGTRMMMRVADNLEGPWSEPTPVYTAALGEQDEFPYFGRAHKILEKENGRTQYISYSVGGMYSGQKIAFVRVRFGDLPAAVSPATWAKLK